VHINRFKLACAAVGLLAAFVVKGGLFDSAPKITRVNGDTIIVGDPTGSHARYSLDGHTTFTAASVGYDYFNFGGGGIGDLGGRATLSYMEPTLLRQVMASQRSSGECIGNLLCSQEAAGRVGHMILIPQNAAATTHLRKARLKTGQKFRLAGEPLTLLSAARNGHPMSINAGRTIFFLVEKLERE
jgi:hypothetical protein